jgi:MFS transporter, DHA2 family, multidrug resistance protein
MHASLVEPVTPLDRLFEIPSIRRFRDPATARGAAALNAKVTRQSNIIAQGNDFHLLMLLLLPLMRQPPWAAEAETGHAVMDWDQCAFTHTVLLPAC